MRKRNVSININGRKETHAVEPRLLLVHFIREVCHLTGTHVGCDTSQCGACTVRMDGLAVKSCTVFAVQAEGADVRTIEDMAGENGLHPIQQAFKENHGLQCGFCTPGMVMAISQLLERYPDPTVEQIHHQLDGNICRCTGYHNIVKSVLAAARQMSGKAEAAL